MAGLSTGSRVSSWTIWKTSGQQVPERVRLRPAGQRFCDGVHECHAAVGIGRDDGVADARQRDAKPFRLLAQCVLGAAARHENALGVLQGDGAKPCVLVARRMPSTSLESCARHRRPLDARANLRERGLPGRGRVVTEGREPTVVAGAQLRQRNVLDGLQHSLADFLGRLDRAGRSD